MIETLADMSWPIFVLIICGGGTLILGWWLGVKAEGKDYWVIGFTGDDTDLYPYQLRCPRCGFVLTGADRPGLYEIQCMAHCGFAGNVYAKPRVSVGEGRDEWLTGDDQ